MSNQKTAENFLKDIKFIHGDKYDYSKVNYVDCKTKITIVCPIHGEFEQTAKRHIAGSGCFKCAIQSNIIKKIQQCSETFIQKANKVHGDKYDYSKVNYVDSAGKVVIICPVHGEFEQRVNAHLQEHGCPKCGRENTTNKNRHTLEKFIEKARKVHGDRYDYSQVKYKKAHSKVTIICSVHGQFNQFAHTHLRGSGCPKCNESKGEIYIRSYLENHNIRYKRQWQFKKSSIAKSQFDFALQCGLIEYNGQQHYSPRSFGSKKGSANVRYFLDNVRRDLKKKNWCEKHKIPLVVIPFWDFERIPEILDAFVAGKEPVFSKPPEIVVKYESMRQKIVERLNLNLVEVTEI